MKPTKEIRLVVLITVIWLVRDAFLGDAFIVGIVLTIPGACALALCVRQTAKGRYESLSPWACCALVPLPVLFGRAP